MSLEIGLRYPHLLAGVIGVSGYAHEPEKSLLDLSFVAKQQVFLMTHGNADPIIPIHLVRDQVQLLKRAGLQIDWHEFEKEHNLAGEAEISLIKTFVVNRLLPKA